MAQNDTENPFMIGEANYVYSSPSSSQLTHIEPLNYADNESRFNDNNEYQLDVEQNLGAPKGNEWLDHLTANFVHSTPIYLPSTSTTTPVVRLPEYAFHIIDNSTLTQPPNTHIKYFKTRQIDVLQQQFDIVELSEQFTASLRSVFTDNPNFPKNFVGKWSGDLNGTFDIDCTAMFKGTFKGITESSRKRVRGVIYDATFRGDVKGLVYPCDELQNEDKYIFRGWFDGVLKGKFIGYLDQSARIAQINQNGNSNDNTHAEVSSQPLKRSRNETSHTLTTTIELSQDNRQSSNNRTVEPPRSNGQSQRVDKVKTKKTLRVNILGLKCPKCPLMLKQDKFDQHMLDEHSISKFRCLLKNCAEQFYDKEDLKLHYDQHHKNITNWECNQCPNYYSNYPGLKLHIFKVHQHGIFKCTFPECTIKRKCHHDLIAHYVKDHNEPLSCEYSGCSYKTTNKGHLKKHLGTHNRVEHLQDRSARVAEMEENEISNNTTEVEVSRPPLKKSRNETSHNLKVGQPRDNRQFERPIIRDSSDNAPRNKVITLALKCHFSECSQMFFAQNAFDQHMLDEHAMSIHRCLLQDCAESFNNNDELVQHFVQNHKKVKMWTCIKCSIYYSRYEHLQKHNYGFHSPGIFVCSFAGCRVEKEYYREVIEHYKEHPKERFSCQHGCGYTTPDKYRLKKHERVHTNQKPYQCIWPGCKYDSIHRHSALSHIQYNHKAQFEESQPNQAMFIAENYLKVVTEWS